MEKNFYKTIPPKVEEDTEIEIPIQVSNGHDEPLMIVVRTSYP